MKQEEQSTQDKILSSAKQEFQEKGFLNASLRNIVKNAGVTTGAFYGYYDSKEALFAALVEEHAAYILALFNRTIDDFEKTAGRGTDGAHGGHVRGLSCEDAGLYL